MNKELWLYRFPSTAEGTFGVLLYMKIPFCVTLEREWLGNQTSISCIPDGEYVCERVNSPKFGNTFEVINVPNRSKILFHKGNLMMDSHGCIIVGEQFEPLGGKNGVVASGKAFDEFLMITKVVNEFSLHIRWITSNL